MINLSHTSFTVIERTGFDSPTAVFPSWSRCPSQITTGWSDSSRGWCTTKRMAPIPVTIVQAVEYAVVDATSRSHRYRRRIENIRDY